MTHCGKSRYPDKRAAQSAMNARMRSHNRPDHLRIYACPICRGWHMTHGTRKQKPKSNKFETPNRAYVKTRLAAECEPYPTEDI